MRPHRLTIKNFGSYSEEQEVDFDLLGNGMFMIAGDTGAGKTTIFDAMVYALYGTGSGTGRGNMDTTTFHCDYAKHDGWNDELRVSFTFSSGERTFRVERSMSWGKKGTNNTATKEAVLYENDTMIAHSKAAETNLKNDGKAKSKKKDETNSNEVTAKITEILGLDAIQFCQIIMLAQGEFRRFLEAGSEQRGAILGKIFDNRMYIDFEKRLDAVNAALSKKIAGSRERINQKKENVKIPEDYPESMPSEQGLLLGFIQKVIETQVETSEEIDDTCKKLSDAIERLNKEYNKAKENNAAIDAWEKSKIELQKHQDKQDSMEEQREKVQQVERAIVVLPKEKAYTEAMTQLKGLETDLEQNLKEQKRQESLKKELGAGLKSVEEKNKPQIEKIKGEYAVLSSKMEQYNAYEKAKTDVVDAEGAEDSVKSAKETAERRLQTAENAKKENDQVIAELESVNKAAVDLAQGKKDKKQEEIKQLEELQRKISGVKTEQDSLEEEFKKLKEYHRMSVTASIKYENVLNAYIEGQAGILSKELQKKILEKGAAKCPVCGTLHSDIDFCASSSEDEDGVSKSKLDSASKEMKEAVEALEVFTKSYENRKTLVLSNKENYTTEAGRLGLSTEWEILSEEGYLESKVSELRIDFETLTRDYGNKKAKYDKKQKALNQVKALQTTYDEVKSANDKVEDALKKATTELAEKKTVLFGLQKQFEGMPETKAKAEELLESMVDNVGKLQKEMKDAADKVEDCEKKLQSLKGEEKQLNTSIENQKVAVAKKQEEFETSLAEKGFATVITLHTVASPEGALLDSDQLVKWKSEKEKGLKEYDDETVRLTGLVEEKQKKVEGLERQDETLIVNTIKEHEGKKDCLTTKKGELKVTIENNKKMQKDISEEITAVQKYANAQKRIVSMASCANSNYSFDRFVLNGFFREILEHANVFLSDMSGDTYTLVMKESYDGRSAAGLDFEVLDEFTKKVRSTSSLSGGESFEVSLSLALGLSEVVQMQSASQIQIESMFIDEGFGSLDEESMQRAIRVLQSLSNGNKQIAIISHVERLEDNLDKILYVKSTKTGSIIKYDIKS